MQNFWKINPFGKPKIPRGRLRINKEIALLVLIILLGAFFRFYGLNWDQGHHLHPDERAIVMSSLPLHFPSSISEFLSTSSPLNPHFFAYGSLPIYLLKTAAVILTPFYPLAMTYDHINLLGRFLSVIFDTGTLILIFFLGRKLFSKQIGLIGALFYAISVFPIQAAHFYAVDTTLTFFVLLTVYKLIQFYEKPTLIKAVLVGIFFGLSLATKTSAIVLISAIGMAIVVDFLLIFLKNPHRPHIWAPHMSKFLKRLFIDGAVIIAVTIFTFLIAEPYSLVDFKEFWRQTLEQSRMTRDAFTFPYTLQYVGKIPYLYELKNIFLWGQGPILATLSFMGALYFIFCIVRKHLGWWRSNDFDSSEVSRKWAKEFILLIFFLSYFAVVGKFAVGWMRYMLPLYPLLCLFAGLFTWHSLKFIQNKFPRHKFLIFNFKFLILLALLAWPLSFMHIYTKPNTRVLASEWIYKNIPADKIIAREHWDDGMPIGGDISYKTLELPIYEMQNPIREAEIYRTIQEADYIIIASNRLYIPLQRIAKNCQKWNLPQERCSKNANKYYEKLFSGELGYKKVAEFSTFPQLSIFNFQFSIDDSSADESFTVYDHPKVMIFKKNE